MRVGDTSQRDSQTRTGSVSQSSHTDSRAICAIAFHGHIITWKSGERAITKLFTTCRTETKGAFENLQRRQTLPRPLPIVREKCHGTASEHHQSRPYGIDSYINIRYFFRVFGAGTGNYKLNYKSAKKLEKYF